MDCDCTVASAVSTASVVNALPNSADNHHQGTPGIHLCNHAALGFCNPSKRFAPVKLNKHIVLLNSLSLLSHSQHLDGIEPPVEACTLSVCLDINQWQVHDFMQLPHVEELN